MAFNAGQLQANLSLNFRQFTAGLTQAKRQVQGLGSTFKNSFNQANRSINTTTGAINQAKRQVKDFERIVGGIVLSQVFYNALGAIQNANAAMLTFMNNMEKAQIAMEYFLGTEERAKGFLATMKDFAATTAFNTEQSLVLSRRLMAAQFDPTHVRGIMEILNDASAASGGTAEQMDRIVLALTQMKTNGKIAGQELRQLAEAGIPIYKILQEELQLTGEEVMNIGDMKISGDLGVAAVLTGLEKRYKGAAERIANTVPGMWETIRDDSLMIGESLFQGPYRALDGFLRRWRDTMEEARDALDRGGLGEVLETLFPPHLHDSIRMVTGSFLSMVKSLGILQKALAPIFTEFAGLTTVLMGSLMPALAGIIRSFALVVQGALEAFPPLKWLGVAIVGLLVAQAAAKSLMFLWGVMRLGTIAAVVAQAVHILRAAIQALFVTLSRNPIVALIMIVSGALLYLALSSKTVSAWLDQVIARLGALGGFDVDEILQPETKELNAWAEEFNKEIDNIGKAISENMGGSLEDAADKGKDSAKKIEDAFTAAFDEVYQIPDPKDKGDGSGGGSGLPGMPDMSLPDMGGLPDLGIPEIPREIDMPKFNWDNIEWPKVPPALTKPINIRFKIDPPTFPPPGAVATAWVATMNTLREALKGLETVWDGVTATVKQGAVNWGSDMALEFGNVLDTVGDFGKLFPRILMEGIRQGIRESLDNLRNWGTTLTSRVTTAISNIKGLMPQMGSVLSEAWPIAMKNLKQFGKDMWENIKEIFGSVRGWIEDHIPEILLGIGAILGAILLAIYGWPVAVAGAIATFVGFIADKLEDAGPAASLALSSLPTVLSKPFSSIEGYVSGVVTGVKSKISKIPGNIKSDLATVATRLWSPFSTIRGKVSTVVTGISSTIKGLPGKIVTNLSSLPGKLFTPFSYIQTRVRTVSTGIINTFKLLPNRIKEAIKSIPDKVKQVLGDIKLPSFSTLRSGAVSASFKFLKNIAGFAEGGIIGKDSIVRVGEGGRREAIIPLQNQTAMKPFVDAVVSGLRGQSTGEPQQQGSNNQQPVVYVHTLIGDERGLRELERKLKIVRLDLEGGGRA